MQRGVLSMVMDRLARAEQPVFWHHELDALGAGELRRLLGARLLVRVKDATRLPCPSPCGKGCGLRVLPRRRIAVCPQGRLRPVELAENALVRYALKPGTFARRLAKANGIAGRVREAGDDTFRLGRVRLDDGQEVSAWLLLARQERVPGCLFNLPLGPADRPAVVLVPSAEPATPRPGDPIIIQLTQSLETETLAVDWRGAEACLRAAAGARAPAEVSLRLTGLPPGQYPPRSIAMLAGSGPFEDVRKPIGVRELFFLSLFAGSTWSETVNGRAFTVVTKERALDTLLAWVKAGRIRLTGRDSSRPDARLAKMWREFVRQMNMTPGLAGLFAAVPAGPEQEKAYGVAVAPDQIAQDLSLPV
jgi:hypothetical protein